MNPTEEVVKREFIECPKCQAWNLGRVRNRWPWDIRVHVCRKCDYMIGESEWQIIDLQLERRLRLFGTGFLQVFFVACSTFMISRQFYTGVFLVGFAISWLWSGNVKKVAFGGPPDRVVYAAGAALGSVCGLLASSLLLSAI